MMYKMCEGGTGTAMSLLESILYGFISGIFEFLPVSSRAHQALFRYLFCADTRDSIQDLLVHIGLVLAIVISYRELLLRLHREHKSIASRRRNVRSLDSRIYYDLRLLNTATMPLIIGLTLCFATVKFENNLLCLLAFCIFNGVVLLIAEHTRHGNRDAKTMTGLDGIAMGLVGALSAFTGISRTGMISAYSLARGADSKHAANWAVLLGIPALLFAIFFDVFVILRSGVGVISYYTILQCFLSGISAFCGGYISITILQMALNHFGFSGFAYYSIGTGLFSFILYLIT